MIYKNLEFHNVTEIEEVEGFAGVRLQRFPKHVRLGMGKENDVRGRFISTKSVGCEIRFVTDAKAFRLYLSMADSEGEVTIYRGNFVHSVHRVPHGAVGTIHILIENDNFLNVKPEVFEGQSFSYNVWRVFVSKGGCLVFHGLDTFGYDVRPPHKDEVPKIKWLAYGSSITHGGNASSHNIAYIQHAARRLGIDVMGCGLSGSCLCEKTTADFLATRGDWDIATLELGINMRFRFNTEEFINRAEYLIDTILEKNPGKKVAVITIYPNAATCYKNQDETASKKEREFNEGLEKIFNARNNPNLYLIHGYEILDDFSGLSADLLHPSDYGHILMGENLAKRLAKILNIPFADR